MNISIYNEPSGPAIGGAEYCSVVLANNLAASHNVDLVHHRDWLNREILENAFGVCLNRVNLRFIQKDPDWLGVSSTKRRTRSDAKAWSKELSAGYDVFVNICHNVPPFCHARTGILYVLFPAMDRKSQWPWQPNGERGLEAIRSGLRRIYYAREWNARMDSYKKICAISDFTRRWTETYWGVNSAIIFPPVNIATPAIPRQNHILCVGRIVPMKRQLELVTAFAQLQNDIPMDWRLVCAGYPQDRDYVSQVRSAATQRAEFHTELKSDEIRTKFASAKIFWHAAGLGINENRFPMQAEHFGIVTVEAMAGGYVPVVINKGGQSEIVEHGISGFLWNTIDELIEYTQRLVSDEQLRQKMSEAAKNRAQRFGANRFVAQMHELICPQ